MGTELTCTAWHRESDIELNKDNKDQRPLLSNFTIMRKIGLGIPKEVQTFIRSDYCCDTHYALHVIAIIEAALVDSQGTSSIEV